VDEQTFITPENFERVDAELRDFRQSAKARGVFLVDASGQLMAQAGDVSRVDTAALAALTASNMAASRAIAEVIGERAFKGVILEGLTESIYISQVGSGALLAVAFDNQTSVGLVRLRASGAASKLAELFARKSDSVDNTAIVSPVAQITEEDIDQLFR